MARRRMDRDVSESGVHIKYCCLSSFRGISHQKVTFQKGSPSALKFCRVDNCINGSCGVNNDFSSRFEQRRCKINKMFIFQIRMVYNDAVFTIALVNDCKRSCAKMSNQREKRIWIITMRQSPQLNLLSIFCYHKLLIFF